MATWHSYALISCLLYGVWGLLGKLATHHIGPRSSLIYQTLGSLCALLPYLLFTKVQTDVSVSWSETLKHKGLVLAMLVGIMGNLGSLFYLQAMSKGKPSLVVAITGLYPIVTTLLSCVFLKDPIGLKQTIGIVLAVIAVVLCS